MPESGYAEAIGSVKATLEHLWEEMQERSRLDRERDERLHQEAIARAKSDTEISNSLSSIYTRLTTLEKHTGIGAHMMPPEPAAMTTTTRRGLIGFIVALVTSLMAAVGWEVAK